MDDSLHELVMRSATVFSFSPAALVNSGALPSLHVDGGGMVIVGIETNSFVASALESEGVQDYRAKFGGVLRSAPTRTLQACNTMIILLLSFYKSSLNRIAHAAAPSAGYTMVPALAYGLHHRQPTSACVSLRVGK